MVGCDVPAAAASCAWIRRRCPPAPFNGLFVNDVVVTRDAAYFTDALRPVLYQVPLGPGGELPDPTEVSEIPLGSGFDFDPAAFPNANGIVATADGKTLIVATTAFAGLYTVDPSQAMR